MQGAWVATRGACRAGSRHCVSDFLRRPGMHMIAVLLVVPLISCAEDLGERLQSGRVLAWNGLQGRWVGPVTPNDASCGQATKGLMTIGEKGFGFDPFASTVVIQGQVAPDGRLSGTLVRQGGNHQPMTISLEATASADESSITGTVLSNRCQWTVTLQRG